MNYQPRAETLDELRAGTASIAELRHRGIQMLLAFHRWDKAWGPYPAQWEVDDVRSDVKTYVGGDFDARPAPDENSRS